MRIMIVVQDNRSETDIKNYLVQLIPEVDLTVGLFLLRVNTVCHLKAENDIMILSQNQFVIPHESSQYILQKNVPYKLQIRNHGGKNIRKTKKLQKAIVSQKSQKQWQSSDSSSSDQESIPQKKFQKTKITTKIKKIAQKNINNKKPPSQSSESSQLQQISKKKVKKINIQTTKMISNQNKDVTQPKFKKNLQKKTILRASSQSSSQSLAQPPPKQNIIKKDQKDSLSTKSAIPISVRKNNYIKKTFNDYKQKKWFPCDSKVLSEWKNQKGGCFLCEGNQIRFKIVQLDEVKFIPVLSDWFEGYVQKNENQIIDLSKVKKGTSFLNEYSIPIINMSDLACNMLTLTQQQKQFIKKYENQKQSEQAKQKECEKISNQKVRQQQIQKVEKNKSLEEFVCGQIHFYFSDKNYNTSLFMQMHANNHPQKCNNCLKQISLWIYCQHFQKLKSIRLQNKHYTDIQVKIQGNTIETMKQIKKIILLGKKISFKQINNKLYQSINLIVKNKNEQLLKLICINLVMKSQQDIKAQYHQYSSLFLTHNSDYLNLEIRENKIYSKTTFKPYELIMQVRGKIYNRQKLQNIIKKACQSNKKVDIPNHLIIFDKGQNLLLNPTNSTIYLFDKTQEKPKSNCFLENHFHSKILIVSNEIIMQNQEIILNKQSYERVKWKAQKIEVGQ